MTKSSGRTLRLAGGAAFVLLFLAHGVGAQQSDTAEGWGGIEEVLVTARKQEESLQDIPLSVSAFGAEAIYQQDLTGLEDVASKTTGFSYEPFATAGTSGYPVIRGLPNNFLTARVQNVAFFMDGIYLQRSGMFDPGLIDMERVEIIKGPQSALYGRNAFAGAINYVTRQPGEESLAQLILGAGADERFDVKGSWTGELSEGWHGKLSVGQSQYDGHTDNDHPLADTSISGPSTKGQLGGWDDDALSGALHWDANDALRLRWSFYQNDLEREVTPGYTLRGVGTDAFGVGVAQNNNLNCHTITRNPIFGGQLVSGAALWCGKLPLESPSTNSISVDPRSIGAVSETDIYTMGVDWDIDDTLALHYLFGSVSHQSQTVSIADRNPETGAQIFDGLVTIPTPPPAPDVTVPSFISTNLFTARPNSELDADSHELRLEWREERWQAMLGAYFYTVEDSEHNINYYAEVGGTSPISSASGDSPLAESNIELCIPIFPPNRPLPPPLACDSPVPGSVGGRKFFPIRALVDGGNGSVPVLNLAEFEDQVQAVFGSYNLALGDSWKLSAEARYSRESKEILRLTDTLGRAVSTELARASEDFDYITPRFTLEWSSPMYDLLLYGSIAEGVKTGGFNATTTARQLTYDEERNLTTEFGLKSRLMEGRLQINAAVYDIRWSDLQGQEADLSAGGQTTVVTGNIGDATNRGLEIDVSYWLNTQLWFDLGFSSNDPKYDSGVTLQEVNNNLLTTYTAGQFPGADPTANTITCADADAALHAVCSADVGGNTLLRTSKGQAFAALNFRLPLPMDGWTLWGRGDVNWQSKQYITALNLAHTGDRTLMNLSLGVDIRDLRLHLWGKNVNDEEYVGSSFYVSQLSQYVVATGRGPSWGLTASYRHRY